MIGKIGKVGKIGYFGNKNITIVTPTKINTKENSKNTKKKEIEVITND